jgi:hypothetical protein
MDNGHDAEDTWRTAPGGGVGWVLLAAIGLLVGTLRLGTGIDLGTP